MYYDVCAYFNKPDLVANFGNLSSNMTENNTIQFIPAKSVPFMNYDLKDYYNAEITSFKLCGPLMALIKLNAITHGYW